MPGSRRDDAFGGWPVVDETTAGFVLIIERSVAVCATDLFDIWGRVPAVVGEDDRRCVRTQTESGARRVSRRMLSIFTLWQTRSRSWRRVGRMVVLVDCRLCARQGRVRRCESTLGGRPFWGSFHSLPLLSTQAARCSVLGRRRADAGR